MSAAVNLSPVLFEPMRSKYLFCASLHLWEKKPLHAALHPIRVWLWKAELRGRDRPAGGAGVSFFLQADIPVQIAAVNPGWA
eukprot:8962650-Ditylum_brightwellii.AAC.1